MTLPARAQRLERTTWIVCATILLAGLLTFRDYGVAWDEQGEVVYGDLLIRFFTSGFRDQAAFEFVNFRFYGGGFELPAALLSHALPFNEYATRHLLSLLVGLAALIATMRVTRRLAGERAALIAVLLLALNPCWYGLSFIDARDVPLAAGIMGCLAVSLHMLRQLPRIRWQTSVLYGAILGWTMSVRVGAVIALAFLAVPIALWLLQRAHAGATARALLADAARIALTFSPALLAAYALIALFWPWAVLAPSHPIEALFMFARFPFEGTVLFQGKVIAAKELPATYLPVYLAVTQPESLLAGVATAILVACGALARRRPRLDARTIGLASVAFAGVFPIAYFMIARPVAYNSMRHFLFVVPLLTVLAAVAFDAVLELPRWRVPVAGALAAFMVLQVGTVIALHPNQYVYFNQLVGGPRGAQGRYELDYWGTSLAEATRRLVQKLEREHDLPKPGTTWKAHVCGNTYSASEYFPDWIEPVERREDADFHIGIATYYCLHQRGSRPVIEVERAGAVLSFVDDQRRAPGPPKGSVAHRKQAALTQRHRS